MAIKKPPLGEVVLFSFFSTLRETPLAGGKEKSKKVY